MVDVIAMRPSCDRTCSQVNTATQVSTDQGLLHQPAAARWTPTFTTTTLLRHNDTATTTTSIPYANNEHFHASPTCPAGPILLTPRRLNIRPRHLMSRSLELRHQLCGPQLEPTICPTLNVVATPCFSCCCCCCACCCHSTCGLVCVCVRV